MCTVPTHLYIYVHVVVIIWPGLIEEQHYHNGENNAPGRRAEKDIFQLYAQQFVIMLRNRVISVRNPHVPQKKKKKNANTDKWPSTFRRRHFAVRPFRREATSPLKKIHS